MSMVKVIEVLAQSDKGFDDAARTAVKIASKTVRDIKEIYIKDMNGIVENGEIKLYRITARFSFLLSD